jgi:hypothetical protein
MSFGDKMKDIEDRAKSDYAETKKDVKDAWTDTKAATDKSQHEIQAQAEGSEDGM